MSEHTIVFLLHCAYLLLLGAILHLLGIGLRRQRELERRLAKHRGALSAAQQWLASYPEASIALEWVRQQAEEDQSLEFIRDMRQRIEAVRQAFAEECRQKFAPTYSPDPPAMAVRWYDSPEAVHRAMWESVAIAEGMTYEELIADSVMCGEDEHGQEYELESGADITGMRLQGCWGFVETDTGTIHAWADPATDDAMVLHMLAHEIGHVTGTPASDDMQEEMRAEQFGRAARRAFELLAGRPTGVTRWCFKCNTHKALDQFTPAALDSPTRDGYNYGCNTCTEGLPKLRRCPETRRIYSQTDSPATA